MTHPRVTFQEYGIVLRATRRFELPGFSGTTFRGALGAALRAQSCTTGAPRCADDRFTPPRSCARMARCAYGALWESPAPTHCELPARFSQPPSPYVVMAEWRGGPYEVRAGDPMHFGVRLFGAGRGLWQAVVLAALDTTVRGLGRRENEGAVVAERVVRFEPDGSESVVWHAEHGLFPLDAGEPFVVCPVPDDDFVRAGRFRLLLVTPLTIERKVDGRKVPLRRFDPVEFTADLLRRLELLSLVHEDVAPDWDFRRLRAMAERVVLVDGHTEYVAFERYSIRAGGKVPVGGIGGALIIDDVHPELAALWRCAAAINVGAGTVFGFGHAVLEAFPDA